MSNYEKALKVGETRELVAKAINAIDPRKVKTIADAIAMISLADGVNNRFNLAKYRTIYNVHATGIWRQDLKANGKPFETFHAWAKYRFTMEKANAYNAVKVGGFVREDGAGSVFDTADAYFNFSQLLEICNAKQLYTNPKTREEFKQVNKIRRAKTDDGHFCSETTFENGKPVTRLLFEIADDSGEKTSVVAALVECGVISPDMTVKAIRKALGKSYTFDKYGAHEDDELTEANELTDTYADDMLEAMEAADVESTAEAMEAADIESTAEAPAEVAEKDNFETMLYARFANSLDKVEEAVDYARNINVELPDDVTSAIEVLRKYVHDKLHSKFIDHVHHRV